MEVINMKMCKESYIKIVSVFSEHKQVLKNHRNLLREKDNVINLEVRLAFDGYYGLIPMNERRQITERDNLKDAHLQTGLLKALRECDI